MAEERLINNLSGVLHYIDTPLLDFEIVDRKLIKAINLSEGRFFPWELSYGITYGNNNLDNFWVKFDNYGAQSFADICG